MHEYGTDKNSSNSSGGSITATNGYFTYGASPRIKTVRVTEYVYDSEGNLIKETVTETEYVDTVQPYQPYQPTWYTVTSSTDGNGYSGPGSAGDPALK